MKENKQLHKILLAVDGSDQSVEAVRYVGMVFPPDRTEVVLFNVSDKLPDLFNEFKDNALFGAQLPRLQQWVTDQQKLVCKFMEKATALLLEAGFAEEAVHTKIRQKKLDVERDIIKESHKDYNAVVVGRTGMSKLKDILVKSVAIKLVDKINHIPVIVVGGAPRSNTICVAFDGSNGSMRGVSRVGCLVGESGCPVKLYSMLSKHGRFWVGDKEIFLNDGNGDPVASGKRSIAPRVREAEDLLREEGFTDERISHEIDVIETDRAGHIIEKAGTSGCDTVVLGRRGLLSFFEEFFVGRTSTKVIKKADELTVWVI